MAGMTKCQGRQNGHDCPEGSLIDAHIVPKGFARRIRREFHTVEVTSEGVRKPSAQLGLFDPTILCATCDGALGRLDDYAIRTIDRIPKELESNGDIWMLPHVDGDMFAKFILSVLWRASISSLDALGGVDLGNTYSNQARAVLFEEAQLSTCPAFELLLARYKTSMNLRPEHLYSLPSRMRMSGLNGYGFALAGFEVFAKLDRRSFRDDWAPMIVNGNSVLRGLFKSFEGSGPFQTARLAVRSKFKPH